MTVLGHCLVFSGFVESRAFAVIYAFHMPYFFFLSGYLYKKKVSCEYISSKVKTLLVPVIIYQSIKLVFYGILFSLRLQDKYYYISFDGYWFLTTLLYITIMYYAVDLIAERGEDERIKHLIRVSSVIILLVLGLIYPASISDQPNQTIATAFVGYFFYVFGFYIRKYEYHRKRIEQRLCTGFVGLFLLAILIVTVRANTRTIDMYTSRYSITWIFLAHALLGTVGMYYVTVMINTNRLLEFFGKNSITVLLMHTPIVKAIPPALRISGASNWMILAITTFLSIFISCTAIAIFNRYMPFMAGRLCWEDLYGSRKTMKT